MTSKNPLLEIRNLSISLPEGGDRPLAVENVSLDLNAGEILCIVGESGSGKSMLARAIMGLLPGRRVVASHGEIRFAGADLLQVSKDDVRRRRGNEIAMIFQEPMTALNPLLTIGAQIDEVLRVHTTLSPEQRKARVVRIIDDVHLPEPQAIYSAFPHQLSGGQRQRAMIAMALILDPKIIIADEPTTALDVTTQAQILSLIAEIQREHGTGVLFITHDFGVVAEIADRVAVMQTGRIVETGDRDVVLNRPNHHYTRALIAAVPKLVATGQTASPADGAAIETTNVSKTFSSGGGLFGGPKRQVRAVKAVDLSVMRGETLGVVGESGSGKSTLARLIIRLIEADTGTIALDGTDIRTLSRPDLRAFRKRVQMIFQDPYASLNPRYRVGRTIAEGAMMRGLNANEAQTRTAELLTLVGLDPAVRDRYPHEFSGGQRQRISIARALALSPDILIADEPVSALDVSIQDKVLQLLADIQKRFHLTLVFITHDLCVAAQICDRIAVMSRGEIVELGAAGQVAGNPRHEYTKALFGALPGRAWLTTRANSHYT